MNAQLEQSIFDDLSDLEKSLAQDRSGDRARELIAYFDDVARDGVAMQANVQVDAERQLLSQLLEAFRASQRVVRHVWEALHGLPLVA